MGIYYRAVDFESKEFIDPPGDFPIKSPGIFHPSNPFAHMVIMANSKGANFKIVNDCYDIYAVADDTFKDKTEYYFDMLKRYWPEYDFEKAEWKEEVGRA